jgi:ATP-dependent DNA helicase DinG
VDEIVQCADSLESATERMLGNKSRLTTAIPGFVARPQQIELAAAVARMILQRKTLVAEAGTGTGKTFAYLIPCLLSGKKTLISTATKTLQDQLFQKDLPMLVRALGLSTRIQNLKGRANYICQYRVEHHAEEARFSTPQCASEIAYVREKLPQLTHGERGELPEIAEDSAVWPYVTSTNDNCLGGDCPQYKTCFLVKARKRALESDLVVINHHLFFADSRLKDEGFGELLPGADVVVFDEAHQLPDIAANFYGERLSTRQFREWMDDTLGEWPVIDLANQPLKQLSFQLDGCLDALQGAVQVSEDKLEFDIIARNPSFKDAWAALLSLVEDVLRCFDSVDIKEYPGLARCLERLQELVGTLKRFAETKEARIRWVERFKHNLVFHATPFEVASNFKALVSNKPSAFIFTSATLTMADSFDCFSKPLGLEAANTLLLTSPFDYKQQALLYLPRSLPDPKHADYYEKLLDRAVPIIEACGGRCFFLFTSHRALKQVAQLLQHRLPFPLLVQGEESKAILLSKFREKGNAVLLGTATFWEGVDVRGEALSCVIIDKIPFASPVDPVVRGKMAYLKSKGLSGFDELSLPGAVLALKQGVGRLIRDIEDRGILMLADPRLTGRAYGQRILASLPAMKKTRDERTALCFIETLALSSSNFSGNE